MRFKKENKTLGEQWWKVDVLDSSGNAGVVYVSSSKNQATALRDAADILQGNFSPADRNHEKLNHTAIANHLGSVVQGATTVSSQVVAGASRRDVLHLTDRDSRREVNSYMQSLKPNLLLANETPYIHHINGDELDNNLDNLVVFPCVNRSTTIANMIHSLLHKSGHTITNVPASYKLTDVILFNKGIPGRHEVFIEIR